MHRRLEGFFFFRCWCTLNFTSFLKNVLCQSAPDVFSCNINFIVCPREVEIVTGEGLNEQIESCLASDRLFPRGVVQVSGDSRHEWNHTTNSQVLLLYISASLSSCPPQHPLGYFWPLMELDWRLVTNTFLPPLSPLLGAAAWLSAN